MQVSSCPYSWQQEQWNKLMLRAQHANLPHAILVVGAVGVGKLAFVNAAANALLCDEPGPIGQYCAKCRSCTLFHAASHPDFMLIAADDGAANIKIDQIRHLIDWLSNTSQHSKYRVAIIHAAELLNIAAANALLKTLEEPNANTIIFLTSHKPTSLPATIISRCQKLLLHCADQHLAKDWLSHTLPVGTNIDLLLRLAEGAPLKALTLADGAQLKLRHDLVNTLLMIRTGQAEPIKQASQWLNVKLEDLLVWMIDIIEDLIRLSFDMVHQQLKHAELTDSYQKLRSQIQVKALFKYYDKLFKVKRMFQSNSNLNQQLVLEDLFYDWAKIHMRDKDADSKYKR